MSQNTNGRVREEGYWRSLQDLADTDDFRRQLADEFPEGVEPPVGSVSRRRFLQIMSASVAMTSMVGCRWPEEKVVPFARRAEGTVPGEPASFATTLEIGPIASAVVATSYDGRPIKIDGNPDFPGSLGAAGAFAQAAVLDLYDPDRSRSVIHTDGTGTTESDWDAFVVFARKHYKNVGWDKVAVLTEATTSPSVHGRLQRITDKGGRLYAWEPVCRRNEMLGAKLAFGTAARIQLDLTRAEVIVDFDANLLQDHPTALRNSRDFAALRNPESGHMNRLYSYEPSFSITGGMADHRFPTAAGEIAAAVWALAAELVLGEGLALPAGSGLDQGELAKWRHHQAGTDHVAALAHDLMTHRGGGLLLAGTRQPTAVHALVAILNTALGNTDHAITYQPFDMPEMGTLKDLVDDLNAGRIESLVIAGGNPVYTAPADLDFAAALAKAGTRVHLGHRVDATSALCTWHIPRAHALESWGDATAWDGTHLSVQPLIEPLFGGKTTAELLSAVTSRKPRTGHRLTRETYYALTGGTGRMPKVDKGFETRWRRFIHDGFAAAPANGTTPRLSAARIAPPAGDRHLGADNLEIAFVQDPSVHDGRFADNAWLQEMPDFMTKLTWDNAALISPAVSEELGVKHGDLVELDYAGRTLEMAVYVLPGQARYSVTAHLGYGREDAGRVGHGVGFDTYRLRTWDALDGGSGLKLRKTGRTYALATTQDHHAIDVAGADEIQKRVPRLVREGTLDDYNAHPEFVDHLGLHSPPLVSLWKEKEYTGHKWGMSIDLNVCTGCNACLVGCQAENNIPVVGKDEVARGREMSWLRLDRYFLGEPDDPKCAQQPVACAHCEMAPCEQVCPVTATLHTDEGLNAMVYNRCVGTRYCSNNCPYKVRRFNWFNNFKDLSETEKLVLNPDVTVRARGVMEKCSYCTQRIEKARVQARVEGRDINDGDVLPACAQTCPTDAIVFGDLNDPQSRVSGRREIKRSYDLLDYLNIKPRTSYMARIRNPNPAIEPATGQGGGHDEEHGEHGHQDAAHG